MTMDFVYGIGGFDPAAVFVALVAVAAGLIVWRRHPADRRARVFLLLAISELAFFVPTLLVLTGPNDEVPAWLLSLILVIGGLSSVLFFHFGMTFPHRRPWLRRDRIRRLYWLAALLGAAPLVAWAVAAAVASRPSWPIQVSGVVAILIGPLAIVGAIAACAAVYRSYREMTADERRRYRAPVMGVLFGMIMTLLVDVLLGAVLVSTDRRVVLVGHVLATAAALLFPLFFFTAAMKFRLLEHHSQEYVSTI